MFPTGCANVTSHLVKMKKLQSRVILFSARCDTSLLLFFIHSSREVKFYTFKQCVLELLFRYMKRIK